MPEPGHGNGREQQMTGASQSFQPNPEMPGMCYKLKCQTHSLLSSRTPLFSKLEQEAPSCAHLLTYCEILVLDGLALSFVLCQLAANFMDLQ